MSATNYPKAVPTSSYPLFASDSGNNFSRVEPLITPEIVLKDYLFGVKLKDPINKQEYTAADIKRAIGKSVNAIELALNINIFPVTRSIKLPFDRNLFKSMGYTELPFRPVLQINKFCIESADQVDQFTFPASMLDVGNLALGLVTFGAVALMTPSGLITSLAGGGGVASPLLLTTYQSLNWIPNFYRIECVTGFNDNQIPVSINELIGIQTALDILSRVGPLFRTNSTSISQDAISQSLSGPGNTLYLQRTNELQLRKKELIGQIRGYFYNDIFVSNI